MATQPAEKQQKRWKKMRDAPSPEDAPTSADRNNESAHRRWKTVGGLHDEAFPRRPARTSPRLVRASTGNQRNAQQRSPFGTVSTREIKRASDGKMSAAKARWKTVKDTVALSRIDVEPIKMTIPRSYSDTSLADALGEQNRDRGGGNVGHRRQNMVMGEPMSVSSSPGARRKDDPERVAAVEDIMIAAQERWRAIRAMSKANPRRTVDWDADGCVCGNASYVNPRPLYRVEGNTVGAVERRNLNRNDPEPRRQIPYSLSAEGPIPFAGYLNPGQAHQGIAMNSSTSRLEGRLHNLSALHEDPGSRRPAEVDRDIMQIRLANMQRRLDIIADHTPAPSHPTRESKIEHRPQLALSEDPRTVEETVHNSRSTITDPPIASVTDPLVHHPSSEDSPSGLDTTVIRESKMAASQSTQSTQRDHPEEAPPTEHEPNAATAEVKAVEEWGSAEEVESLNREIMTCLEIEKIPPPPNLFKESLENFRSVAHYYVHVLKQLDAPGIDLLASLESRFGEDHSLVIGMKEVLSEMSNITFVRREPTVVREERHRAGDEIPVPGLKQFSDESRSLSWVVRTQPLPTRQTEDVRHRTRLEPIAASIGGVSRAGGPGTPKQQEAQIICPGLPVSFDGYEQPPPHNQIPPRRSTSKKPFLSRLMSCLCFAS